MIEHFEIPDKFLKLATEKFMTNKLFVSFIINKNKYRRKNTYFCIIQDLESILSSGCWLKVIFKFDKSTLLPLLLRKYGFEMAEFILQITKFLKALSEVPMETYLFIAYVSWLQKKLHIVQIKLRNSNVFHLDFREINCMKIFLLHTLLVGNIDDIEIHDINFHQQQWKFISTEIDVLNVR